MRSRVPAIVCSGLVLLLAGCGPEQPTDGAGTGDVPAETTPESEAAVDEQTHPDVVDAEVRATNDAWQVSATISSPYDTPERYADAFRVLTPDGEQLGVRELLHHHADEQPFTRSLDGLHIPEGIDEVIVEGRDLEHGYGGATVTVVVPR